MQPAGTYHKNVYAYVYIISIHVGVCMCIIDSTCINHVCQIHNDEGQEAFEDSGYFRKISEKSIGAIAISTH